MSEIKERLKDASNACISSYEEWSESPKSTEKREALLENVHELRKVASRLEIEIAMSERDEVASRPIPIPPHRSSKKNAGGDAQDNSGDGDDVPKIKKAPTRRRKAPAKSAGAGGNE